MKIGIVGLGYWGKKVLNEYLVLLKRDCIEHIYIYDTSRAVTKGYLNEEGITVANTISELLSQVDGVHICTPNKTHFEIIMKAFDHNTNVLAEKPLTINSNEAFLALDRSLELGLTFQVGNIFRFANSVRKIKELVKTKLHGQPVYIDMNWSHVAHSKSSIYESVGWDLLPHALDILNFLTDEWPVSFHTKSKQNNFGFKDKYIGITFNYSSGLEANVRASLINHLTHRDIEIVGVEGTICCNPVSQKIEFLRDNVVENINVQNNNTILDEILNFITSIRDRKVRINSAYIGAMIVKELESIMGGIQR